MACDKAAVALLTFSPPDAKAWLYDLIDANPATGIMLCRRHANATVVPMSWQLIDSRDPAWAPPGEPAAPRPQPAAIPGLLTDETALTEPLVAAPGAPVDAALVSAAPVHTAAQDYPGTPEDPGMPRLPRLPAPPVSEPAAAAPAMATILSTTVQRPAPAVPQSPQTTHHTAEPAAFTPTVTAPSTTAAMPASPMVGTAAVAVVAPPLPAPHIDPPVAQPTQPLARRTETIRVEALPGERISHVVGLNEQIAAHARPVEQQPWTEPAVPGPPAAADLVANLQERLLPDPSLFELPLDTPAVTPHQGYR